MITDLDETIRQLLIAELPIKNNEIDISFDQPKREWSARLTHPTVNFFLYDLRENQILRQHQWERVPDSLRSDNMAHLKRTPFRVDLFYMLTTWAAEPEDEHRLLSRVLLTLFRYPVLPQNRLVNTLKNQPYDLSARLASHDKLTNPAEVWSSLDNEMRPSISYIITLAMDPWTEVTGPVVRTLTFRAGTALQRPIEEKLIQESLETALYIGGTVRSSSNGQNALAGVEVSIGEARLSATTNASGRFVLGSLLPGTYTLIARASDGKTAKRTIQVPAEDGNYDLVL